MRKLSIDERRARIGRRHRLADAHRATDPADAAEAVVALHGTDATSVFLGAWARMRSGDVGTVEKALYEDRSLLRIMSMRRTMFVSSPERTAVMFGACSQDVARRERARLLKLLAEAGVGGEEWLAGAERAAIDALRELGEATAPELAAHDARLATELVLAPGTKYEAKQKVVSRILTVLAARGDVIRTRPRGSWTSTQFRWARLDDWFPGITVPDPDAARAELARVWLRAFGPGTEADLRWWAGWTAGATRGALAELEIEEVDLHGGTGLLLADDLEPESAAEPWVALLPALDSTTMGWKERDWYVGEHGPLLFDRNGNAGPTIWADGRVVGAWAQAADGEIRLRMLEDVGAEAEAAIDAEADALTARVDGAKLSPRARGRSPLERELLA